MGFFANADLPVLLAFLLYLAVMLGIGFYFTNKSKKMSDYFLAGRGLNSWVTAMSAQASDMSGWLLMGLPGAAYATGMGNYWIAIGLAIGTILNWAFVAKPLRRFTEVCGDSITIPQYLTNRFLSKSKALQIICAVIFLVAYTVYAASSVKACGTLFNTVIGMDETAAMYLASLIIIAYTFLGGFSAVCWTDFFQGMLMLGALLIAPIFALFMLQGAGVHPVDTPNYFNAFSSWKDIVSGLGWGLGYFGMPHILLRFMAIEDEKKLVLSRRIASVWVVIAMTASIVIGVVGLGMTKAGALEFLSGSSSETLIVRIASLIAQHGVLAAVLAGLILAGILAATMSTADSQMLAAASSVSQNILQEFGHMKLTEKQSLFAARLTIICVSVVGVVLARDPDSSVFGIVSFAWAGFGGSFGAVVLCALFWKRCNWQGALAGMLCGGLMVFVWKYIVSPLGGVFGIYELLPAFLVSLAVCVVVSLVTPAPTEDILAEFDAAK